MFCCGGVMLGVVGVVFVECIVQCCGGLCGGER